MKPLKPPRLSPGDLIGLVSPASPIADHHRIQRGVRYLERRGFRTVVGKHALKADAYLAGSDDQRVADLHDMFGNNEVHGVMCIRGGYGAPRILPLLDYELIARHPKVFVGYSDITALQLALWRRIGLVTFHGPMVGVEMADTMDSVTEDSFWNLVTSPGLPLKLSHPGWPFEVLAHGQASGRLLGGNLSLVVSLLGTPFQPDFRNAILFLEDTGEEPYRIDRMFAHLRNASILSKGRAILTGQFPDCLPKSDAKPSFSVAQVLLQYAEAAGKPFLAGLQFGHGLRKLTFPVGIRVSVNSNEGTIECLESAVL